MEPAAPTAERTAQAADAECALITGVATVPTASTVEWTAQAAGGARVLRADHYELPEWLCLRTDTAAVRARVRAQAAMSGPAASARAMASADHAMVPEQEWLAAYSDEDKELLESSSTEPPWTGLRFANGQRVMRHKGGNASGIHALANMSGTAQDWESGMIVKCWQKLFMLAGASRSFRNLKSTHGSGRSRFAVDNNGADRAKHRWAPYQILLDSGTMATVLRDEANCVRRMEEGEAVRVSGTRKRHLMQSWTAAPRMLAMATQAASQSAESTLKTDRLLQNLDGIGKGGTALGQIEEKPEEWHASVLRSEIRDDLWNMFKLAKMNGSSLDLDAAMPIFQAVEPGITQEEVEKKFDEMDEDGSGDIDFDEMQKLWWSCIMKGQVAGDGEGDGEGEGAGGGSANVDSVDLSVLQSASAKLNETVSGIKQWRSDKAQTTMSANLLTIAFKGRLTHSLERHYNAAVLVQTRWRKNQGTRWFRNLRRACIVVQRKWRTTGFMRQFRKRDTQQLELVKQWAKRTIDISICLPPTDRGDDGSGGGRRSPEGISPENSSQTSAEKRYWESNELIRSEEKLRSLLGHFGEIVAVRRYYTTERWHSITSSGLKRNRWPIHLEADLDHGDRHRSFLQDTELGWEGAVREPYALVCFHDENAAEMLLSRERFAAENGLQFGAAHAEWSVPRESGYGMAARASREYIKVILLAKRKKQEAKHRAQLKKRESRSRLTSGRKRSPTIDKQLSIPPSPFSPGGTASTPGSTPTGSIVGTLSSPAGAGHAGEAGAADAAAAAVAKVKMSNVLLSNLSQASATEKRPEAGAGAGAGAGGAGAGVDASAAMANANPHGPHDPYAGGGGCISMSLEDRASMAAWWTSVVAVHTGVLTSSVSGGSPRNTRSSAHQRPTKGRGQAQGQGSEGAAVAAEMPTTTSMDGGVSPYEAMQREMVAATKRLRHQRQGRQRQPVGSKAAAASKRIAANADGSVQGAAATAAAQGGQGGKGSGYSRFTAMEAQPAGQVLPQWADPHQVEAARTNHERQKATHAVLAATHAAATTGGGGGGGAGGVGVLGDNMHRHVMMAADAVAAGLTAGSSGPPGGSDHDAAAAAAAAMAAAAAAVAASGLVMGSGGKFVAQQQQQQGQGGQQQQHLMASPSVSSLSLSVWLRAINAPIECLGLMVSAGLHSLDEMLDAELTEPQLLHMGFTQMKQRKDAMKTYRRMVEHRKKQQEEQRRNEEQKENERLLATELLGAQAGAAAAEAAAAEEDSVVTKVRSLNKQQQQTRPASARSRRVIGSGTGGTGGGNGWNSNSRQQRQRGGGGGGGGGENTTTATATMRTPRQQKKKATVTTTPRSALLERHQGLQQRRQEDDQGWRAILNRLATADQPNTKAQADSSWIVRESHTDGTVISGASIVRLFAVLGLDKIEMMSMSRQELGHILGAGMGAWVKDSAVGVGARLSMSKGPARSANCEVLAAELNALHWPPVAVQTPGRDGGGGGTGSNLELSLHRITRWWEKGGDITIGSMLGLGHHAAASISTVYELLCERLPAAATATAAAARGGRQPVPPSRPGTATAAAAAASGHGGAAAGSSPAQANRRHREQQKSRPSSAPAGAGASSSRSSGARGRGRVAGERHVVEADLDQLYTRVVRAGW